jgi:hypothetical protein
MSQIPAIANSQESGLSKHGWKLAMNRRQTLHIQPALTLKSSQGRGQLQPTMDRLICR